MRRWIVWVVKASSFLVAHGPQWARRALANILAFLWFDLFRIRRDVIDRNIAIAFPELSPRERVRLGRKSLRHLGLSFVEYADLPWLSKEKLDRYFEFHNLELLDEALSRGRGVLLLTLHLGNGDLAVAGLAVRGYPMVLVSKLFKLKWLNEIWFGLREQLGVKFVPPRDSSFALLKALKKNQVITVPLDQFTGPPIGVRTTFFGVETGTAAGLSVMAERSGAPVLSVYTVRTPEGRHAIHFIREMPVRNSPEETTEQITQRFNDELESFVRLHPEQWMWIHRRWKKFKF